MSAKLEPELRHFLEEKRFAVLSTLNPDGTAQQSVVWYELRGNEILMNTRRGRRKDRNMRRDPRVSVCIADGYRYITLTGSARLIDEQSTAQRDIGDLAARYHGRDVADRQVRDQFAKERRVTIRLPIEHVGRYGFGG